MTASGDEVEAWYARNSARRAAEVDFGMVWTSLSAPREVWRVSWNSGSHELFAARRDGGGVQVLAVCDSSAEAESVLAGWARHAGRPGGLDWVRERTRGVGAVVGDGRDELREALRYRVEHFDELEMSGRINMLDAYIDGLESSMSPAVRRELAAEVRPAVVVSAGERDWLREQLGRQRPATAPDLGVGL